MSVTAAPSSTSTTSLSNAPPADTARMPAASQPAHRNPGPFREDFCRDRHIRYFSMQLKMLPQAYAKLDTNRLTLAFFCVSALDLLGALDQVPRQEVIDWVYSLHVSPDPARPKAYRQHCGFVGGGFLGGKFDASGRSLHADRHVHGHITMSYTALAILLILGDDCARVDREAILSALGTLQRPDGSYAATAAGSESDMRFLYCAAVVSRILGDWRGVDAGRAAAYIRRCTSFDGGIGLLPDQESHGGSTFCAIAALHLMGRLDTELPPRSPARHHLVRWCLARQVGGFQGRCNKPPDTCYSFWVGGTLMLLGPEFHAMADAESARAFHIADCMSKYGGFQKVPDAYPDVLHSFFSIAALSMMGEPGLLHLDPALCVSVRAASSLPLSFVPSSSGAGVTGEEEKRKENDVAPAPAAAAGGADDVGRAGAGKVGGGDSNMVPPSPPEKAE